MIKLGDNMLVNTKAMLNKAKEEKYAIAQFNINNLEWTKYILEVCEELKYPVILGVSEGAIKHMGGVNVVASLVKSLINDLNITVDVALHLDHGSSLEICKKCIDAGFTSVMIDASSNSLEENINITKQVTEYAYSRNVTVEGEIGKIGGTEDEITNVSNNANTEDVIKYVNSTNIDSVAPALGSVHGPYKGKPNLDFKTMQEIGEKVQIPLVLHGGSGIPDDLIKKAISCGINKINVNTELQQEWAKGVKEYLQENNEVYDPRKIINAGEKKLKQVVKEKLILFKNI